MVIEMQLLLSEVDNNAQIFSERFPKEITHSCELGLENVEGFRASYRRVVSLQSWRAGVFEQLTSTSASSLFLEAQNDALLSLVLAHMAMWRPALQSLRSCIENVLNTCYYVDHPIEFQLWEIGNHRNDFSQLATYFSKHPNVVKYEHSSQRRPDMMAHIRSEYADLSKAVHASAKSFHMTRGGEIKITNTSNPDYNQWVKRHSETLCWLNFLLIVLNENILTGAQNAAIRQSTSLAIPARYHNAISEHLGVHLFLLE